MTSACGSAARRSSRLERARSGASMIVTRSRSKKTLHAAEQDRPDVAAARAALKAEQPSLKAPRLVFIDETAVTTKMVRHYGRSPRGERLVASVPHGRWHDRALCHRWRDGWANIYCICRTGSHADPEKGRYRLHGQFAHPQGRWRAPGN